MNPAVLSVEGLRTWFPTPAGTVKAVDDVSFAIGAGRVLALVGESGSGKSITAYSLLRLLPAPGRIVAGRVLFGGLDLAAASPGALRRVRGAGISMVFQDPASTLNPVLRIGTQMTEAVRAHARVPRAEARVRAREALRRVGFADVDSRLDAYPHEFSGGMRQRVVIAMALLHRPKLIVADEPTTALDVTVQAAIVQEVRELVASAGTALLWITHDLSLVDGFADDLAVMYAGRIVEFGPTADLLSGPAHPYTAGLLASLPERNRRGRPIAQIPGVAPVPIDLPPGCPFRPRCPRALAACTEEPPAVAPAPGRSARCWNPIPA